MEIEFNNFNGYYIQPELNQTINNVIKILVDDRGLSPLITLVGPSGSGKNTLSEALLEEYIRRTDKKIVIKMRTEEVVDQCITSIRENKKYGQFLIETDILIMMDIEELLDRPATFKTLLSIVKKRIEMGRPVILTANIEYYIFNDQLRRYFNFGSILHIRLPGFYLRKKLVAESIKRLDYILEERFIDYIADHVISDMNLIDTIVRNIEILVLKEEKKLDIVHIQHVMNDFISIKGQWV